MPVWNPIVTIKPGGEEFLFAQRKLTISEARTGRTYQYRAALESVDIPVITSGQSSSRVVVPTEFMNIPDLRDAGILLGGAEAEIALWREGDDFKDRQILLTGRVEPNGVHRMFGGVSLDLSDYAPQLNRRFPPYVMTTEGFPNVNENQIGKTMNVLYGAPVTDVPVQLIDPYNDPIAVDTYNDDIRFVVAGHRLAQATIRVRGFGSDAFTRPVQYGFDHASGATFAYFTLTQAQMQGASTIVCDVFGHERNGFVVAGLGDVIEHAILTYSGLPADRIDYDRLAAFIPRANRLAVASIFGGDADGTLMGLLGQRYGEPFGVRLDWQNGKFGADLASFDPFADMGPPLRVGHELIERVGEISYVTEDASGPYSSFELEYDPNMNVLDAVGNPSLRAIAMMGPSGPDGDERCAEAYSRFGHVPFPRMQSPDVNLAMSARTVLDWAADRFAVQRTKVSYLARLDDVIGLPILRPYAVTDPHPQANWTDVRMQLDSIAPQDDDTAVVTLRSYLPSR